MNGNRKDIFFSFEQNKKRQFFTYLSAIIIGFLFAVIQFINPSWFGFEQFLGVILFAISLLATVLLIDRYSIFEDLAQKFDVSAGERILLYTREEIEEKHLIKDTFKGASEVHIMALNSTGLLLGEARDIKTALDAGTKFIFIGVNPESQATREIRDNKIVGKKDVNPMKESLKAVETLVKAKSIYKNNLSYYITDVNLPQGIMIVLKGNETKKVIHMKVDLYSIDTENKYRLSFIVPNTNRVVQDFFKDQWDKVYKKSTVYHDMTKGKDCAQNTIHKKR
jgi:hypothetical protein